MMRMERKYIKPASLMLGRLFEDQLKTIFPNPEERKAKSPYVAELELRTSLPTSLVFITSPQLEGIAVWVHSDNWGKRPFWRLVIAGLDWPAFKIGVRALYKMEKSNNFMESKHKQLVQGKHWYLALLAVDTPYQGKGFGSMLLNEMLNRIDEEGLPCYLETFGEKNPSMYQHFGFQVVDEYVVPGDKEATIAMVRQPKVRVSAVTQTAGD